MTGLRERSGSAAGAERGFVNTPSYIFGQSAGIQPGISWIESRAAWLVGTPHVWKNGPRFFPVAREKRTIH